MKHAIAGYLVLLGLTLTTSCQNTQQYRSEAASSKPVNKKESIAYKQALIRCHKTGGTRIVKINSVLRCF
ncbi:MAG: hypothetical protein OXT67_07015 [Zetaproteobacteria bacterium]|nr:hypothetical protein [Zetaproteobacteria bacterium]